MFSSSAKQSIYKTRKRSDSSSWDGARKQVENKHCYINLRQTADDPLSLIPICFKTASCPSNFRGICSSRDPYTNSVFRTCKKEFNNIYIYIHHDILPRVYQHECKIQVRTDIYRASTLRLGPFKKPLFLYWCFRQNERAKSIIFISARKGDRLFYLRPGQRDRSIYHTFSLSSKLE